MATEVRDRAAAREMFAGCERRWDAGTIERLEALGVEPGWSCLEVGAGAGSIVRWLAERVGVRGSVVATDTDPHFLFEISSENVAVWRHNAARDPLPFALFDLIHARLVLADLGCGQVCERLVGALRPDGWLLVEDRDPDGALPDLLRAAGLVELGSERRTGGEEELVAAWGRRPSG